MRPIRLLHISDLHDKGPRETDRWQVNLVTGPSWEDNLAVIAADGRPIDFICFTGDVAYGGLRDEYVVPQAFIARTTAQLCVPSDRVFIVPGNHDIDRSTLKPSWEALRKIAGNEVDAVDRWLAGGPPPSRVDVDLVNHVLSRQQDYRDWIGNYNTALLPQNSKHQKLGYRQSLSLDDVPFPVHIIGVDSAFLAGDDDDPQKLLVTHTQVGRLLHDDEGNALPGLRIALYHHPLSMLVGRDMGRVSRLLASSADIALRGHLHDPQATLTSDPDRQLLEVAAGCLYGGSNYPNSINIIDLTCDQSGDLTRIDVWVRSWSENAQWANDNTVYANAKDGRFFLDVTRQRKRRGGSAGPSSPPPSIPPPPVLPPPQTPQASSSRSVRARAYSAELEANAIRAREIRTLRAIGIDRLAWMFRAAATELSLGFEGPLYGDSNGEAKEEAALSGPRGYLDLRRVSLSTHDNLQLDVIFKASAGYIKPFPYPENEELLAEGACNILVPDGMWISERIAIIAKSESPNGQALITADANRLIDAEWISNRVDVLIGLRLPGITGLWRCLGQLAVSELRIGSRAGVEALEFAVGNAINEVQVQDAAGRVVGLADVLSVPKARRRQLVASVFEKCVSTVNEHLDFWVRFDLCDMDAGQNTAEVDVELKPVGEPVIRIRYKLSLRRSASGAGPGTPPTVIETTTAERVATVVSAVPPGFVTLDTFIKREIARDVVGDAWALPMVGRETSLGEVLNYFRGTLFRLFPVVGVGGIGKTRFLAEVAKHALQDGIIESVYCASASLELRQDWHKGLPKSERCLLVIDDPPNAAVVRWISDELCDPDCRWRAIVAVRSFEGSVADALAKESRNKFIAPQYHLNPLSLVDATLLATKALDAGDERPRGDVVSWVARMSHGVPVWLLLASRIILDGADLRDLPKDRWRLAERYVREALAIDTEEYALYLRVLRWIALLQPLNRDGDGLVKYVCERAGVTTQVLAGVVEQLRRRNLVVVYGANTRMVEVRPAILRDYLVTSWLTQDTGDGAFGASEDGRVLVEHLAADYSSLDHAVLQRVLASLGRVDDILGHGLPVLSVLGDSVERAASSAADTQQQLEALSLASMAAPARLESFVHAARTLRTTTVPDYTRTESWGQVTRRRSEVLQALPWALFSACQYARTRSECKQLVDEMLALVAMDPDAESGSPRNDGKRAAELIPRLVSERLSPAFRSVLLEAARLFVSQLQTEDPVARVPALAVTVPLVSVVVEYNWTEADRFVWGHYVLDPQSSVGQDVASLAAQILSGLKNPGVEANAIVLWDLFEKYHEGLMRAMMEGNASWTDELLECLTACRRILTSRHLSGREWFHARKVWHWHARYDKNSGHQAMARSCEELFTSRPEFGPFFPLVFGDLEPEEYENAVGELATRVLAEPSMDVGAFFDSVLRLVDESGEQWRAAKVHALARRIGASPELSAHVERFVVSVKKERSPLFEVAASVVGAHISAIRRAADMAHLRAALDRWASVLSPTLFIEEVYLNASVLVQAHLSSTDWGFLVANLHAFLGIARWRLLGIMFGANGYDTRVLVDVEVTNVAPNDLHEMIVWFWVGFHSRYIVEENAKRPALTAAEFDWFLGIVARVPDLKTLSHSFVDDLETVGNHHPKHSATWLCALVQERRDRFVREGLAMADGFWPISHDRLFLAFAAPAQPDDASAIDALMKLAGRDNALVYLSEFVVDLDSDGVVVPQLVVSRLRALADRSGTLDEIAHWAEYASSYAVGSAGWRRIAEAACERVARLPHDDRARVYWQLFHQRSGVWSGRVGEVSSKWTSAVTDAEAMLQREGDGPLGDLLKWRLEKVQEDLRREQGYAQEELASAGGLA